VHLQQYIEKVFTNGKNGIKQGLSLPEKDLYDIHIELNLTRKQTNEVKELLKDKNKYKCISDVPFDYLPSKSRKHDPTRFYVLSFKRLLSLSHFPL
jgi:hypothetical protein